MYNKNVSITNAIKCICIQWWAFKKFKLEHSTGLLAIEEWTREEGLLMKSHICTVGPYLNLWNIQNIAKDN